MIKCVLQFEIFTILNSLQFSIKLNQIKCWFLERGENWSTRRKNSRSRVENQQTQPTYDAESGNRTRDTLVEGERSYHYADPAPPYPINCTSQSSSLGVTLGNKLSRTPHIQPIAANFNAKINKLKQIKSIYFKGILPSTTYCISLWGCSFGGISYPCCSTYS